MDQINNSTQVDRHIIIFGHAMNDMSMFNNLKDYPEKENEYLNNRKIYLDLLNCHLEYTVFSCYYAESSFDYRKTNFSNDTEFMNFLENIGDHSFYNYDILLSPMDKILTLSTCSNKFVTDGRSIIHAKLSKQIKYSPDSQINNEIKNSNEEKEVILANVYLKNLSIKYEDNSNQDNTPTNFAEANLSPDFDEVNRTYSVIVPTYLEKLKLVFETADHLAKTEIKLNDNLTNPD